MQKLKGLWIPADILLNEDLSDKEKFKTLENDYYIKLKKEIIKLENKYEDEIYHLEKDNKFLRKVIKTFEKTVYNIPTSELFGILLIQAITVAVLLYICVAFIPNEKLKLKRNAKLIIAKDKLLIYAVLFVLVILGIFRILPCMLILAIVILTIAITDIKRWTMLYWQLFARFLYFQGILLEYLLLKNLYQIL